MITQTEFEERRQRMLERLAEKARAEVLARRSWSYCDYLQSAHWQMQRRLALRRALWRCQLCATDERPLEVHHCTYENIGHEMPEDLTVLCDRCHGTHHDALPTPPTEVAL